MAAVGESTKRCDEARRRGGRGSLDQMWFWMLRLESTFRQAPHGVFSADPDL